MKTEKHGCSFKAATVRVPWANPVCPSSGAALPTKARASEALAHGTRIGLPLAIRCLRIGVVILVFAIFASIAARYAFADDLITASEVQWHIESLGVDDDDDAARVEQAAERANAEAAELAAVVQELGAWRRSLRGPGGMRMLSLLPNGLEPYLLDWFVWQRAEHEIASSLVDGYFDDLEGFSDEASIVETLRNAHTVAHFSDANNIRQEKLRALVADVLPGEEAERAALEAALAQHEKNLAAIYREWKKAELMDVPDRVAAWVERDFEMYLKASLRLHDARHAADAELQRGGEQMLALMSGEGKTTFNRDFRRMRYGPTFINFMDDYDKAMARTDLPETARAALIARRERFFEDHDRALDERQPYYDRWRDPERVRASIEAGVRFSFFGEPLPAEVTSEGQDQQAIIMKWAQEDRAFQTDIQAILREHGAIAPEEKLQVTSAPYAADVPDRTDPTWRFYYSNPVFGRPDLERMLDACEATDDQRTLARAIYDDYRRQAREKAVELGRTVTELDAKREEFKRENPDAEQGADYRIVGNEYGRLDAEWSSALVDFDVGLWSDIGVLFDPSQRLRFERAVFDAHWERLNQKLRSGNMGGHERHLLFIVEEALQERPMPAECAPILNEYRDEVVAMAIDVRRRLKFLEIRNSEARDERQARNPDDNSGPGPEYEAWVALFQKPAAVNAQYRELLIAAAIESDRALLQRAFDKEVHPELFVASPIDLLVRELEEMEAGAAKEIDQDRFETARSILDNARGQYERNTMALMAAKKEWSGEGSQEKWQRWREDHPPPDPARPHLDRVGPMDHLWDQRLAVAKNACAQVARLFPPQERTELPAGIQLLLMWPDAGK
jgi:hypothetical protein